MLAIGLIWFTIFCYLPMYWITIAFREYDTVSGYGVYLGFGYFHKLFNTAAFVKALKNNIGISLLKLVFGFPSSLILALMINEVRSKTGKKLIQTSVIMPDAISWFIIAGLLYAMFNVTSGAVPGIIRYFDPNAVVSNVMTNKDSIILLVVVTHIWQAAGMGTVVYLAAMMNIDSQLYEAAIIDGAGRWKQLLHVTLPSIRSTIIMVFIIRIGDIMNAGFDQIFALSNPIVKSEIDIIDTFVYRYGMEQAKFSEATAAGLFKSLIALVLVLGTNFILRKIDEDSAFI